MLAVDTNVVIRFLVNDDAAQHKHAVALFRDHTIWLAKTVLLESEWVLRSVFGFAATDIARAFDALIRLPDVRCEDPLVIHASLEALSAGMDFADALHLVASQETDEGFASFDARFVKQVRKYWPEIKIRTP